MCRSFGLILVWQSCLVILTLFLCIFEIVLSVLMWINVKPES
jgi:hypothetical protein